MTMTKEQQDFFNKKMRVMLLGELSLMSQTKVIELCRKFFQYGLDYDSKK